MRANPEAQRFVICTTSLALAILLPLCVGMGSPGVSGLLIICLLYTSDAADEMD
jgi:hypothetical protein